MHQPFSFTKHLSIEHIYRGIRDFYYSGITLEEFSNRLEARHGGRYVIVRDMFISSHVVDGVEYVLEDSLIRESLMRPLNSSLAKLYLFALLINMPGLNRRPSADSQNDFVRNVLYQNTGWESLRLNVPSIQSWVTQNVTLRNDVTRRKFSTNFNYYFDQCEFDTTGILVDVTKEEWVPVGLRLVFERLRAIAPNITSNELVTQVVNMEIYKLMGVERAWFQALLNGAVTLYLAGNYEVFTPIEVSRTPTPQNIERVIQRRLVQVNQIVRYGANVTQLEEWYNRTCQICRSPLPESPTRLISEAAHIRPLGNPHNGIDHTENMISLCPNHHRQLDRGGIQINFNDLTIVAPNGTSPAPLARLYVHPDHQLNNEHFRYHANIVRN